MLSLPDEPRQSPLSIARRAELRQTPLGEELGAQVRNAFEMSMIGQVIEDATLPEAERAPESGIDPRRPLERARERAFGGLGERVGYMDEESYRASEWFRDGVEWDQRMTPERAEALAEIVDKRNYRQSLIDRSPGGVARGVLGFGASLVGAAPDPVNYVPFFGPAARAAAVARMGSIGGRVTLGAAEGAVGAAIVSPYVAQNINRKGGDVGANEVAMDIVLSAVLGGAFGAGAGAIDKRRAARALRQQGAKRETAALAKAVEDLVDDEPVDVRGIAQPRFDDAVRARLLGGTSIGGPDISLPVRPGGTTPFPLAATADSAPTQATPTDTRLFIPETKKTGDLRTFKSERSAQTEMTKKSIDGDIVETPDGFVIRRRLDADFSRRPDGLPEEFASKRAAEREIKNRKMDAARIVPIGEGKFGILLGGDDKVEATLTNHADLVNIPRGEDRSAAASIAARGEVAARRRAAAQPTIDAIARDAGIEIRSRIEDIPHYREAGAAVQARSAERSDYADIKTEADSDPFLIEIDEMRKSGELDAEAEAMMRESDEIAAAAENYAIGYETLAGCVVRHG